MKTPGPIGRLIGEFTKLPGIGEKTAERMAFYILKSSNEDAGLLAKAIMNMKRSITFCKECNSLSDLDICKICGDEGRDKNIICVVEESHDMYAVEKSSCYKGLYHVLMGTISPLEGIGPGQLKINGLVNRIQNSNIKEIIIATNPTSEGEATAVYLAKVLKPLSCNVTRIARGLPVGGDLEYADPVTLSRSFEGRINF